MTGATKKRSIEILQQLEGAERGIYSGVLGYADVGGGGDWAVIIRSCFKYDEQATDPQNHLHLPHDSTSIPSNFNGRASAPQCHLDDALHRASSDQSSVLGSSLTDEWTVGAGGAITALSDPVAEWEEMLTKVESVLRAFNDISSH